MPWRASPRSAASTTEAAAKRHCARLTWASCAPEVQARHRSAGIPILPAKTQASSGSAASPHTLTLPRVQASAQPVQSGAKVRDCQGSRVLGKSGDIRSAQPSYVRQIIRPNRYEIGVFHHRIDQKVPPRDLDHNSRAQFDLERSESWRTVKQTTELQQLMKS